MIKSNLANIVVESNPNNYTQGRKGYKVCKITPHHMAGVLSAKRCGEIFQSPNRQASANYGIGNDGEIACYVGEENRAWTSSNRTNDYQAITIEVSNCEIGGDWKISDAAWNSLVRLCVDICTRYDFKLSYDGTPNGSLTRHNMFANTNCPGKYLQSRFQELADTVNKILDGNLSTPTPVTPSKKSNDEIATEVINGKWGNGDTRIIAITNAGYDYSTIQSIVNSKLGATTPAQKPQTKSIDEVAKDVINGKYGNGADRKTNLEKAGYNYNEVQNKVNELLGAKSTASNKKSNEQIANEIIQGKWGNGDARKQKLAAAGYNYSEIQKIVNRKLK